MPFLGFGEVKWHILLFVFLNFTIVCFSGNPFGCCWGGCCSIYLLWPQLERCTYFFFYLSKRLNFRNTGLLAHKDFRYFCNSTPTTANVWELLCIKFWTIRGKVLLLKRWLGFLYLPLAFGSFLIISMQCWPCLQVIPVDKTGNFDTIYNFLEQNWNIARWVALGVVVYEVCDNSLTSPFRNLFTMRLKLLEIAKEIPCL